MADTLFGPADDAPPKARTPANAKGVRDLVRHGVPEAEARGYENRQAYAVLARKQAANADAARVGCQPPPEGERERAVPSLVRGAPDAVRRAEAQDLRAAVAAREPDEALIGRMVRGCLYLLAPAELRRFAGDLADRLDGGAAPATPPREPGW